MNSDLKQENFLSEYEKLPQLQQIFDFKKHQQAAAVMLRTAQIPLFCIAYKLGDMKHELQTMVEACGAIVADFSDKGSSRVSYGPKRFPLGLRPMFEVLLKYWFHVNNLGLNNEQLMAL